MADAEAPKRSKKRDRKAARDAMDDAVVAYSDDSEAEADSDDSDDSDDDEAMRLDSVLDEAGVADVVFDFDDPQEKHAGALVGLLRRSPALAVVGGATSACDALADIVARDPASVGTVVETAAGGEDVVCCAAVVRLHRQYARGANAGVDAVRATLASIAPPTAPELVAAANPDAPRHAALVLRGRMVNVPPRVVAAAYRCLLDDLGGLGFDGFVVLAEQSSASPSGEASKSPGGTSSSSFSGGGGGGPRPVAKKTTGHLASGVECDDFDDDIFAAKASVCVPLERGAAAVSGGHRRRVYALYLAPDAFRAAVAEISRLAEL